MNRLKKPTSNFTVVPNEIFDLTDISADARFAYIYLLSRPEGWNVRIKNVQKRLNAGREKTYRILKELKDSGLLSYQRLNDGGGAYTLHEITTSRKAESVKAESVKSADIVNTDKTVSTDKDNNSMSDESDERFEELWKSRPQRPNESKQASKKAYLARRREGISHADLMAGVARYATYCKATHTKPQHIKHLSTFLNAEGHWSLEWTYTKSMQAEAIPRDDDAMVAWGIKNGYGPFAPSLTYAQIRTQLESTVTLRKDKAA